MARIDYWQYMIDRQGNPLQDAEVRVYLAGTLNEADIYLNATFGSVTKSSTENLKTNKYGFVQFWVGDTWEIEGGYNVDQQFKIVWQNNIDGIEEEIDNFYVFTPVRPIDTTDSIKGIPSNKDKDKVISNKQGYKWDMHVDSVVPSASPHDLHPVDLFNLNETVNKVISNKLGYQMYQIAQTASTTSIDISAARFYSEEVSSWSVSGGRYYADITHGLNNAYPIVVVAKVSILANNDYVVIPDTVKSITSNTIRIWLVDNIKVRVGVYG